MAGNMIFPKKLKVYLLLAVLGYVFAMEVINGSLNIFYRSCCFGEHQRVSGGIITSEKRVSHNRFGKTDIYFIEYAYAVNGESFLANFVRASYDTEMVKETLSMYRESSTVNVYYKKDNPSISMLELGKVSPYLIIMYFYFLLRYKRISAKIKLDQRKVGSGLAFCLC